MDLTRIAKKPKGVCLMAEEIKKEEEIKEEEEKEEEEIEDEPKTYTEKQYKKLQSESIKRKGIIDKRDTELQKFKDEKLTEGEKKDAKIKELETEKEAAVNSKKNADTEKMIMGQASTKGFADIDDAILIIKEELKLEEDITEATIKKAVDKIAKDKPYLIGGDETTDINKGNREGGKKIEEEETIDDRFKKALQQGRNRNII